MPIDPKTDALTRECIQDTILKAVDRVAKTKQFLQEAYAEYSEAINDLNALTLVYADLVRPNIVIPTRPEFSPTPNQRG